MVSEGTCHRCRAVSVPSALVARLWAEKSSTQGNGEQKSGVDEDSSPSALYRLCPWGSVTDVQSPLLRTPLACIPAASAPQRRALEAALQHKSRYCRVKSEKKTGD